MVRLLPVTTGRIQSIAAGGHGPKPARSRHLVWTPGNQDLAVAVRLALAVSKAAPADAIRRIAAAVNVVW